MSLSEEQHTTTDEDTEHHHPQEKMDQLQRMLSTITKDDVPSEFVDFKHPGDYTVFHTNSSDFYTFEQLAQPPPVWVVSKGPMLRYFVRLCLSFPSLGPNSYIPISFLIDSGAVDDVYWSAQAQELLRPHFTFAFPAKGAASGGDATKPKSQGMLAHLCSCGMQFPVHFRETTPSLQPLNVLGVRFLMKFPMVAKTLPDDSTAYVLSNLQSRVLQVLYSPLDEKDKDCEVDQNEE